jgi:signal transduction histidine kinase
LRDKRTTLVTLLVAVGVLAPCIAWYMAGSKATHEQAERLRKAPLQLARLETDRLAFHVAMRLESLRESEVRRPYTDYRAQGERLSVGCLIEEPLGGSPLSMGPSDPLVWAHFQIDSVGQLTLPHSSVEVEGESLIDAESTISSTVAEELECAAADYLASIQRSATSLGRRIVDAPEGMVIVGPFSWHTATIENAPALVALREVVTPSAVLSQGWVVNHAVLAELVHDAPYPATIRPGVPEGDGQRALQLSRQEWTVELDLTEPLAQAEIEAAAIHGRFRLNFALGAVAALLAGIAIIVLVRRLERLAAERARFAASAAHELRTPLAGLRLYGEMLAEGLGAPDKREEYARRISDEANRLGRVVANVMGFSQLQRDGVQVKLNRGNLVEATRDSVEQLRPAIEAAGAQIELTLDSGVPDVDFDSDAVHQILQNLLDNAEKYSRESEDRRIDVRVSANGSGPVLSVRDHGPGVHNDLRRRLFVPFERSGDADAPAGLGVGLALVQALAEAQGAKVAHRKGEGGGAFFSVTFPPASDAVVTS